MASEFCPECESHLSGCRCIPDPKRDMVRNHADLFLELWEATKKLESEETNPVPCPVMRRQRRTELFAVLAKLQGEKGRTDE
jgi:hypothetical protein